MLRMISSQTSKLSVIVIAAMVCIPVLSLSGFAGDDNQPIGKGVAELPIFDAHVHYKEPAWAVFPPATVMELMDRSGVAMALVSSTPDEGTIRLWEYAPNRIVPELRPYHDHINSSNWTQSPEMMAYLKARLDSYPHEGLGEFHLHRADPDDRPFLEQLAAIAIARSLYVHVHSGKGPVDLLFEIEPKLNIIWAHAGMSEPAQTVEDMMASYDTLYADTSFREWDILTTEGAIDAGWRKVLERFPDRFMIGSDTWVNGQWEIYQEIIATNRKWLSQFSRPIAESIAYKNAERLFGRTVDGNLIGQR